MISMTRNQQAGSNTRPSAPLTFGSTPSYEFYEQVYSTPGPQEWITLPDSGQSKVVISFPTGSGTAFLEGTCSPPDMLGASGQEIGVSPAGVFSPIVYPVQDMVQNITSVLVEGETAIRMNVVGGTVAISVRC